KAEASSKTEYETMLSISVGRRPKRSAMRPKRKAPMGRMARVRKIPSATAETLVLKSVAMALRHQTMMKKSKASSDQPRKQAMKVRRCVGVRVRKGPSKFIVP